LSILPKAPLSSCCSGRGSGQALHDPVASPLEANENIRNEYVLFGIGHSNSFQSFEESSVDRLGVWHWATISI
jgi:hypothetical protein